MSVPSNLAIYLCRRCGHEHGALQCPVCGQPRPEEIATAEQRRAYRQRLFVAVRVPLSTARSPGVDELLRAANHRVQEVGHVLATYQEPNFRPFLKLWELISEDSGCELLFNGQRRPFDRELWIPLLWIAAEA